MSRCSSSKRRMMWRLYVVSSASTRMSPGSARLTAARNVSRSTSPSCAGNVSCSGSYQWSQNGAAAPDEVLPGAALRLVEAERRRAGERRSLERGRDAVRVVAVARLVHRRPERVEARLVVPRRHAHVAARERRAERVHGRIEPVRALLETERCEDPLAERLLLAGRRTAARGTTRRPPVPRARARRARAGSSRTPRPPRSSACTARSRRGAACTASRPTRSSRRSGA